MGAPQPPYAATATHPAWGEQAIAGQLVVQAQALVFESAEGNCELPLDRLVIERDAAGQIQFTDPKQPDCVIRCEDEQILKSYFFRVRNPLRLQIEALRQGQENTRNLKLTGGVLLTVTVGAVLLWYLTGWISSFLVHRVPVAWEAQLGKQAFEELQKDVTLVEKPEWPEWFQPLTDQLVHALPRNDYQFQFYMVEHPSPNAFALPGGKVVICRGLFEFAKSQEEAAGVIAHEMAHVVRRHGIRQLVATAGPYYVLRIFISDRNGFMALVSKSSRLLLRQSFSRDYEREADEWAWRHLVKAGVNPEGLITFFDRLAADPENNSSETAIPNVLSSHPPTRERIQLLKSLEGSRR